MNKIYLLLVCILTGCSNPLEKVSRSKNPIIKNVMTNDAIYEVQIIYTEIDTSDTGAIVFKDYSYKLDQNEYFYPASTVMLPMSVFAAEYVESIDKINLDTPYAIAKDSLKNSVANDIELLLTENDANAYNRLYDLVGNEFINKRFRESGLSPSQISHRLDIENTDSMTHKEFIFFPGYTDDPVRSFKKEDTSIEKLQLKNTSKGKGYFEKGSLVNEAKDFSHMNYVPLSSLHTLMKRLVFPDNFDKNVQFKIEESTRLRILKTMNASNKETDVLSNEVGDYKNFYMQGDSINQTPDYLEIYNKMGYGLGTMTETSYISDQKNNICFFLSATILVNKNGVYDDAIYEYEEVGLPFLSQLGKEFYKLALLRKD
ncbi:serine hydrolase [Dokdonia sp. Hel_I_53]|uniref:serine hydrolase n=1 Tax=Dokdonia sp. Hel_I_53 TaxID=1566287 RepID=UPI00119A4E4B|nr:serine hydrolase [Dokdonia sp. Hel_I_53]TVZ51762.1 beta-lactamase family protein [Dokdonia sp. Hel_I_53]